MYKDNTARKINDNKLIKIKKNNKNFKNKLIIFAFVFSLFSITLFSIFIFLFNQAKFNEFTYRKFGGYDNNLKCSESFPIKDTKNFECISCATEDKAIIL